MNKYLSIKTIAICLCAGIILTFLSYSISRNSYPGVTDLNCYMSGSLVPEPVKKHGLPLTYHNGSYPSNGSVCSSVREESKTDTFSDKIYPVAALIDVVIWSSLSWLVFVLLKTLKSPRKKK
jgi:hypothetical protein